MHQIEVDVVSLQRLQRRRNAFLNDMVPGVVEFCRNPDLISWDTRVLDTLADLMLVTIRKGGVNVAIASVESCFHSFSNFIWRRLPCS